MFFSQTNAGLAALTPARRINLTPTFSLSLLPEPAPPHGAILGTYLRKKYYTETPSSLDTNSKEIEESVGAFNCYDLDRHVSGIRHQQQDHNELGLTVTAPQRTFDVGPSKRDTPKI